MKILIVDDEKKLGILFSRALKNAGYESKYVETAESAISILSDGFDIVISDIKMPGMNGLDLLRHIKKNFPDTAVVMMTAHGTIESAIEAMKTGAYDYLLKPFPTDELIMTVERISRQLHIKQELDYHRKVEHQRFGEIIGKSESMLKVFDLIAKVAPSDATVLILGETGTGKELVARAIHNRSNRNKKPFVAINCAAITETLLESELFGYERGAFTGANKRKPGMFELADSGTLFLDEIAEMPPQLQAKLLRVLQEKTVYHLGGTAPIKVDVRIISATNKILKEYVNHKKFREDLYFRLAVFPIELPPLRERTVDIPLLSENFLSKRLSNAKITSDAMNLLKEYDFPGNVRELENILERALILSSGKDIKIEHLPDLELSKIESESFEPGETTLNELEKKMLLSALEKSGGNKSKAAKLLGITRRMIYTKLKKYGFDIRED
ncbi:sigma-54-dependent Fis family transcriptional regulator [bacterium]|nr:sigma-54-dependent Fis family transcriptional regulator [bacterium]